MKKLSKKNILLLGFVLFSLPSTSLAINKETKLKNISQTLRLLENKQKIDIEKQQSINQQLERVDISINNIHLNIQRIQRDEQQKHNSLNRLNNDIHALKKTLTSQQTKLTHQLALHYHLGQYPYLKLLLNQQNPALTSRLMVYLSYLNQARLVNIKELLDTKQRLQDKESALKTHISDLQRLTGEKQLEETALIAQRRDQASLIKALNIKLSKRQDKIAEVRKDRAKLLSLLSELRKKQFNERSLHFARMRKKLPWPTKGRLTNHFNQEHDGITYHGIIIKAREGNNIRAIYPGKVAFSGWLNGYGLILIINHGRGYMSLYANNQALYRQRGDVVATGDIIASLGHSGGQLEDGLYFEIRHNGKPVSPTSWLK